jgi:predicted dehydrogenase/threonine dehydrogenase-like Zn-dependent dehydrogenase
MKQVMQDLSSGKSILLSAPVPQVRRGHLLVNTRKTLISTGTERMLVDFGKASLLTKARQQPEKVVEVLAKVRTDGLATTVTAVRSKLGQPIALGYCNVGVIAEVGADAGEFKAGDRVVSNGPHADVVCVGRNLAARVPDNVPDEHAVFTVVASIGLQGLRLAQPTLGEAFVVTGVGLIGLLTVQLLRAQGCRVLAIDFDAEKLTLAREFGAETCNPGAGEDPVAAGMAFSRGIGVDGVIITASTKSSDPVTQAARMSRKRGRIVLVGVTGLDINRTDFYEKELSFQVSCSYGPGRYDADYEERGQDYPIGFVRWSEQRNFTAILDLMASDQLHVEKLITHRHAFEDAPGAYDTLTQDKSALGIILDHSHSIEDRHDKTVTLSPSMRAPDQMVSLGVIGAGNYASRILIPAFKASGAHLRSISSAGGTSSAIHGNALGFEQATTDIEALLSDTEINTIAIATRHNGHARSVIAGLSAGKHVFVEKPLAMTLDELAAIEAATAASDRLLMVGFNRRFAPHIVTLKKLLTAVAEPKSFVMTVNAGAIPATHWTQDAKVGGGRIIGEACHFIDLLRHLAGAPIVSVYARSIGRAEALAIADDKVTITLGFADGSIGTIHYLANGPASIPKERLEIFAAGRAIQMDNFIKMTGFGWSGFSKQSLWKQDKGQAACVAAFIKAITSGNAAPIPLAELFEVARVTIEAAEMVRDQR